MAETTEYYQKTITDQVDNDPVLNLQLASSSTTALYRLWAYIVGKAHRQIVELFDTHKVKTEETIANMKPHSKLWYRNKALAFQYGYSLPENNDEYAVIDDAAKIIAFAAADEVDLTQSTSVLKIKVAKDNAGQLAELTTEEMAAFTIYIERVKDAGVRIRKISQEADHLRLAIDIYYDPMVLDGEGQRLDGTNNTPVQNAISNYLENLPFNGEFSIMALTDSLQLVPGVKIPQVLSAETYWGTYAWQVIKAKFIPEAGWMRVYNAAALNEEIIITENDGYLTVQDGHLTINWIAHNV